MTTPHADTKTQRRRHWPVTWSIVGAIALAIVAWFIVVAFTEDGTEPGADNDAATPRVEVPGAASEATN